MTFGEKSVIIELYAHIMNFCLLAMTEHFTVSEDIIMIRKELEATAENLNVINAMIDEQLEAADCPIEPVYRDFKGWKTDISVCRTYESLPAELKDYIAFIEQETGVPIDIVSVGPDRDATIYR